MEANRELSARSRSFAAMSCACCCSGVSCGWHGALLRLPAGPARTARKLARLAARAIGRGGGLLRGRRRRKRRILPGSGGHCRLLLFLRARPEAGSSSPARCCRCCPATSAAVADPFAAACCAGVFLPVELKSAATITSNAAPRYTNILRFFCSTPLGSLLRAPRAPARSAGRREKYDVVLGHGGYPFRVNSIRFLPSSTYPSSMTFGMMYVPSRRS